MYSFTRRSPHQVSLTRLFEKDCKHCHLLDLTWIETHSFGISAPTLPEIVNGFSVGGGGRWRYPYHKQGARWLRMWTASLEFCFNASECQGGGREEEEEEERSDPHRLGRLKTMHPELSAHTSLPLHCSPFLYLDHPHLFISPAGRATKTPSHNPKWSSDSHILCCAHFPTPHRQSLVGKIKMRPGWRERGRFKEKDLKREVEWERERVWEAENRDFWDLEIWVCRLPRSEKLFALYI